MTEGAGQAGGEDGGQPQAAAGPGAHRAGAAGTRGARLTGRAAILAVVLCAIALSLAYPVREYIAERRQIDQLQAGNAAAAAQVARLRAEKQALTSPGTVERLARDKLHMCFPDQTCYTVIPATAPSAGPHAGARPPAVQPWYGRLWDSVRAADQPAAK